MAERIVTVKAEIAVPATPNFFRMTDGQTLPIEAVSEPDLQRIGELWTAELRAKARQRLQDARAAHGG